MNKDIIVVKDVTYGTSTNAEAIPLYVLMDNALLNNKAIVLSLKGCTAMSTSFLNSSIGSIVDKYGWDALKGKLSVVDYNPTVAGIIKSYLEKSKNLVK
jgi:hypothetical protein